MRSRTAEFAFPRIQGRRIKPDRPYESARENPDDAHDEARLGNRMASDGFLSFLGAARLSDLVSTVRIRPWISDFSATYFICRRGCCDARAPTNRRLNFSRKSRCSVLGTRCSQSTWPRFRSDASRTFSRYDF
jgi:hypothetical protein